MKTENNPSSSQIDGTLMTMTPSVYGGKIFNKLLLAMAWIPIFFIFIKALGLNVIPLSFSEELVAKLGVVWPLLPDQFEFIKQAKGAVEAANYAAFYLCLFASAPVFCAYVFLNYSKNKSKIKASNVSDILILPLMFFAAYTVFALDTAEAHPNSIYKLFVDSIGLYYFRQYVAFSAFCITVITTCISFAKLQYPFISPSAYPTNEDDVD
jgi:hypothetical protein